MDKLTLTVYRRPGGTINEKRAASDLQHALHSGRISREEYNALWRKIKSAPLRGASILQCPTGY